MPSQPVRLYQGDSSWESFAHGNGGNCHAVSSIPFLGLFFVCIVFSFFSFFYTACIRSYSTWEIWDPSLQRKQSSNSKGFSSSRNSFKFSVALRPQRPQGLLGTWSPGRPPRISHSSWALQKLIYLFIHTYTCLKLILQCPKERGRERTLHYLTKPINMGW